MPGEIARAKLVDRAPQCEVGGCLGVAEHDVGAFVDELADVRSRLGIDAQMTSRDGAADAAGGVVGKLRGDVRHPRSGLCLPVHHEEFEPTTLTEACEAAHRFWGETAASLGEVADARRQPIGEIARLEKLEGVGHAGERSDPMRPGLVPERRVGHRSLSEDDARSRHEVAVQHREAVAVVHRQRGCCPVSRRETQVLRDGLCVAQQVLPGQPNELR